MEFAYLTFIFAKKLCELKIATKKNETARK